MKKYQNISTLFYIVSALFNLLAIISLSGGMEGSTGFVWLSVGSVFLCLGSLYARKSKENRDDSNSDSDKKNDP